MVHHADRHHIQRMSEERISRSAGYAFLAQMVGAALTAILTIFLGRSLSAEEFGSLTFALGVVALAGLFADLGIASSTGRFMAERRDDPAAAAAVFRTGMRLKLRVGLVASVTLFALAGPICHAFGASAAVWPLRGLAISLLTQSMFLLLLGAFIALGKIKYNPVLTTVESVVEVLASIVLVLLGAAATGAAFGNAIGYTVGLVVGLAIASRAIGSLRSTDHERPLAPAIHPVVSPRQILSYARPLLLVDAAFRLFSSIDVLLIAAIVGGGAPVAAFGLSMRLAVFLDYPAAAVAYAVAPRLARWREGASDLALYAESLRYLLILQMLFTAPAVIWPEAILHLLFGDRYPEAPAVLRALAPFVYLSGIAQITTLAVNYLGEARRRVPIAVAMLTVNAVIDVVLLPRIGIVAAAIGTSAAYALWVPAHVWILRERTGLELRPLALTALRTCVAGAAMVGTLAIVGTGQVPIGLMAVGLVVGPLAYVAALFAVRELTFDDVVNLRGVVARRVAA
jgi:O-antigen/teichoic acid export membrane protein